MRYLPPSHTHARPVRPSTDPRWRHRPPGSNWGDFGPDDQLGRLNLVTPAKVREGVAEVVEGLTFCLSLPLDVPGGSKLNPRRHPPVIRPSRRRSGLGMNFALARENADLTDLVCDDWVEMYLQYSTQWDALSHVGGHFDVDGDGIAELVYYNGFRAGIDIQGPDDDPALGEESRAWALGIEHQAVHGIQGRGVMIDLCRHFGTAHRRVSQRDIEQVMKADGVQVTPGDIVCLHTGFADLLLGLPDGPDADFAARFGPALDGRDPALQDWIVDSGIAALCADNYAVEAHPPRPQAGRCALLPLHELCLWKLGMPLGELWHLGPLADWLHAHGRTRFLLTAPPLRLPGAVGSPVTPIATV